MAHFYLLLSAALLFAGAHAQCPSFVSTSYSAEAANLQVITVQVYGFDPSHVQLQLLPSSSNLLTIDAYSYADTSSFASDVNISFPSPPSSSFIITVNANYPATTGAEHPVSDAATLTRGLLAVLIGIALLCATGAVGSNHRLTFTLLMLGAAAVVYSQSTPTCAYVTISATIPTSVYQICINSKCQYPTYTTTGIGATSSESGTQSGSSASASASTTTTGASTGAVTTAAETTGAITTFFSRQTTTGNNQVPTTQSYTVAPIINTIVGGETCKGTLTTVEIYGDGFLGCSILMTDTSEASIPFQPFVVTQNATFIELALALSPGTYDISLSRPGYNYTLPAAITAAGQLLAFYLDPPTIYNGIPFQVTIWTVGVTKPVYAVDFTLTGEATLHYDSSNITQSASNWNRILVIIPAGTPAGAWTVTVTAFPGCSDTNPGILHVVGQLLLNVTRVDPPYIYGYQENGIAIYGGGFQSVPRVYISPSNGGTKTAYAAGLRATVWLSSLEVTAVVPANTTSGTFDVLVINPNGKVGLLRQGLHILTSQPPLITAIIPGFLYANGASNSTIEGLGFDAAAAQISLQCQNWLTPSLTTTVYASEVGIQYRTTTQIQASVPALGDNWICVVRVTNGDGSYFDYSAIDTRLPSTKLKAWQPFNNGLNDCRRGAQGVNVEVSPGVKYMYAIGGDDGTRSAGHCYTTVESTALDKFGTTQAWFIQRYQLPVALTYGAVAKASRFLYYSGGWECDTATVSQQVWRAEVLDPLKTPTLDLSLTLNEGGESVFTAGLWFYRVASYFAANDSNNPGGDSLPGEVLTIILPDTTVYGLVPNIILTWNVIPDAVGYKLYRSPYGNADLSQIQLLATLVGHFNNTFIDQGFPTVNGSFPLPIGSTGVWHKAMTMLSPRWGHDSTSMPFYSTSNDWFIQLWMGMSGEYTTSTYLTNYEHAHITITPAPVNTLIREFQSWGTFSDFTVDQTPSTSFGASGLRIGGEDVTGLGYHPTGVGDGSMVILGPGTGFLSKGGTGDVFYGGVMQYNDTGSLHCPSGAGSCWQTKLYNSWVRYGYCFFEAFGLIHAIGGLKSADVTGDAFPVSAGQSFTPDGSVYYNSGSWDGNPGLCMDPFNMWGCVQSGWSGEPNGAKIAVAFGACGKDNSLYFLIGGQVPSNSSASCTVYRTPQ